MKPSTKWPSAGDHWFQGSAGFLHLKPLHPSFGASNQSLCLVVEPLETCSSIAQLEKRPLIMSQRDAAVGCKLWTVMLICFSVSVNKGSKANQCLPLMILESRPNPAQRARHDKSISSRRFYHTFVFFDALTARRP